MKNKIIVALLIVLVVGLGSFVVWMVLNPRIGDSKVHQSRWDGSVKQVVDYIKEHAHDAKSYESVQWDTLYLDESGTGKYFIRHKFRIKNGFGALRLTSMKFYLDADGNIVDTEEEGIE